MTLVETLTIAAIIIGPISAVLITRWNDTRSQSNQRKMSVFRSLMKTRKINLDTEHVLALNLVEIEFYKKNNIIQAYRKYIEFRHEPLPPPNNNDQNRHANRGDNLLYDLLHEIGTELGYHFDKDDLKRFSYSPQGWADEQFTMQKNAGLLTKLLEGKIALPVTAMPPQQDNPFPPVPSIEN